MGVNLDMDSPIELPIERKQKGQLVKKHIIVKNHIREVFDNNENSDKSTDIQHAALKTSDSNNQKRKSNEIEALEKQVNKSTKEITPLSEEIKDFDKLNKIYHKCKTILNRIEEKYGDKLRDVKKCEEENNLNLKRSYPSSKDKPIFSRRVGYDKDGNECILNCSPNSNEWCKYTHERPMQSLCDDRLQNNFNQGFYADSKFYAERPYYGHEEIPDCYYRAGYEQNGYNYDIQHPLQSTMRQKRLFPDASYGTESEKISSHQIQRENRRIIYDDDGNTRSVDASLEVDNYEHLIQEYIEERNQLQIEETPELNKMTDNVRDLQQILQLPDLKMHERERVIQRLNQLKRIDSYEMRALKYGLVKKLKKGSANDEVEFCGSNLDTILGYGHDSFL